MLVDVSHHNTDAGPINWATANRSIDGVYIKVTEGLSLVDPAWQTDYTGAGAQAIPRGPYHFADLGSATAEADHFADQVLLREWELVPVLDIEKTGATADWLKAFRSRFRARMTAAGRSTRFRVYTSVSFLQGALAPGGWVDATTTIWAARYAKTLGFDHPNLVLWQNTSTATLPGFVGSVDEDQYQHGWTPAADQGVTMTADFNSSDAAPPPGTYGWDLLHLREVGDNPDHGFVGIRAAIDALGKQITGAITKEEADLLATLAVIGTPQATVTAADLETALRAVLGGGFDVTVTPNPAP